VLTLEYKKVKKFSVKTNETIYLGPVIGRDECRLFKVNTQEFICSRDVKVLEQQTQTPSFQDKYNFDFSAEREYSESENGDEKWQMPSISHAKPKKPSTYDGSSSSDEDIPILPIQSQRTANAGIPFNHPFPTSVTSFSSLDEDLQDNRRSKEKAQVSFSSPLILGPTTNQSLVNENSTLSLSTSYINTGESNSDDSDFSESKIPVKQEVPIRRSSRPNKDKRAETPYYMTSQPKLRHKVNITDSVTHNYSPLPKTVKKARGTLLESSHRC
jgi:hypothetical protein